MLGIIALIGVLLIILGVFIAVCQGIDPLPTAFIVFGVILLTLAGVEHALQRTPSALDVYRGKTELIITQKDSVTADSVVVFKW